MPTIRKANVQDISLVAQIHFKSLPDDFFPSLGLDFLETVYYPASLKSEHAATLVTEAQDEVSGFVTVATDSSLYNRDILRRAWIKLPFFALRAVIRNPSYIKKNLEVFYAAIFTKPDPILSEIVFIAIDPRFRSRGLGKELVRSAMDFLKEHGSTTCRTKTLASNTGVIHLYESLGWQVRNHHHLIGNEYVTIVSENVITQPIHRA